MPLRLSFIAIRRGNLETYRFAGLSKQFHLERLDSGRFAFELLSYPTRKQALQDLMKSAETLLRKKEGGFVAIWL